jgi:hypothetical protein
MNNPTSLGKAASILGTAMMLAWTFLIGVFGFALLIGVYYAMGAQNSSLIAICCFGLALPILLTAVFGLLSLADAMMQKIAVEEDTSSPTWWEMRKDFRVLYQAYYL